MHFFFLRRGVHDYRRLVMQVFIDFLLPNKWLTLRRPFIEHFLLSYFFLFLLFPFCWLYFSFSGVLLSCSCSRIGFKFCFYIIVCFLLYFFFFVSEFFLLLYRFSIEKIRKDQGISDAAEWENSLCIAFISLCALFHKEKVSPSSHWP